MYFEGSGIIYLKNGDCFLKNLRKNDGHKADTLRIVLQNGSFNIQKTNNNKNYIDSSLCSFVMPSTNITANKKGKLNFDGQKEVNVYGNVLVDYLYTFRPYYTDSNSTCLAIDGKLKIMHDPALVSPDAFKDEQYCAGNQWISIGTARSSFAMSAQGEN